MSATDVTEFIGDLDGGVFEEKLGRILSEVAGAVVDHGDQGRSGQVQITLDMKRIGSSAQVEVKHKLSYKRPTAHGDVSENNVLMTPMYVGAGGQMSLFPKDQADMFHVKQED